MQTEVYSNVVFKNVEVYSGWNLQANKTLYVQVANGLKSTDLQNYADELAIRLSDAGKIESFTGPFRPHLQCGDEAIIVDLKGSKSLGLITEITHKFGKSGFITDFTVDSGEQLVRVDYPIILTKLHRVHQVQRLSLDGMMLIQMSM